MKAQYFEWYMHYANNRIYSYMVGQRGALQPVNGEQYFLKIQIDKIINIIID